MSKPDSRRPPTSFRPPRYGVARIISKAGHCSRSEAEKRVRDGRVQVNGRVVRDPEHPVRGDVDRIQVDAVPLDTAVRRYVMLNKPRGLVTTTQDERGRDTVYRCFDDAQLPWIAPVGRLDKASEGLLLFSNDPAWAARITDPTTGPSKTYHVQVQGMPDVAALAALREGTQCGAEWLRALEVRQLRSGERNAWLEIELDEGRNRHIRRLLEAFDLPVLRLVRVRIGGLELGELAKGQWRELSAAELRALSA